MKLVSFAVKALFGMFDHEIPMSSPDHLTIIHGPNGFGKTVMLKMIAAMLTGDEDIFLHVPFNEVSMAFEDGTKKIIRRSVDAGQVRLQVYDVDRAGREKESNQWRQEIPKAVLDRMDREVPSPYARSGPGWIDRERRQYTVREIIQLFPRAGALLPDKLKPNFFSESTDVPRPFFIETNRLHAQKKPKSATERYYTFNLPGSSESSPDQVELRVQEYSVDVVRRIKDVLGNYAKHSQELDRTFPERLVEFVRARRESLTESKILERMNELEANRKRLVLLGFLDQETGLQNLSEHEIDRVKDALTIYVSDVERKLTVFEEMAARTGTLIDIINDRFLYKKLRIQRDTGFCIASDSGEAIQLNDLSSGEQHEIVMLYELLFRSPKNGIILIDEPEISLHAGWQSSLLQDLISILSLTSCYAVVATHSPIIIGPRWDLTVALTGPKSRA